MTSGWAEGADENRDAGPDVESEFDIDPRMNIDDERLLRDVPPHHGA